MSEQKSLSHQDFWLHLPSTGLSLDTLSFGDICGIFDVGPAWRVVQHLCSIRRVTFSSLARVGVMFEEEREKQRDTR